MEKGVVDGPSLQVDCFLLSKLLILFFFSSQIINKPLFLVFVEIYELSILLHLFLDNIQLTLSHLFSFHCLPSIRVQGVADHGHIVGETSLLMAC